MWFERPWGHSPAAQANALHPEHLIELVSPPCWESLKRRKSVRCKKRQLKCDVRPHLPLRKEPNLSVVNTLLRSDPYPLPYSPAAGSTNAENIRAGTRKSTCMISRSYCV